MEILFVILAVILLSFIFYAFLNYVNDKIEDDESKKINTQKLLDDLHQNLTEGKINQKMQYLLSQQKNLEDLKFSPLNKLPQNN